MHPQYPSIEIVPLAYPKVWCEGNGGYVTVASTLEETAYGFVFFNCRITGNAPKTHFLWEDPGVRMPKQLLSTGILPKQNRIVVSIV